jgi:hypothetical protein
VESHTVVTEDGYRLTIHRIPYSNKMHRIQNHFNSNELVMGSKAQVDVKAKPRGDATEYAFQTSDKPVVFLQHGVLASSLDWVLTGPHKALGEWPYLHILIKNGVFWDVTPYGYCKNRRFGGT